MRHSQWAYPGAPINDSGFRECGWLVSLTPDTFAGGKFGGAGRDRTADKGFADLCLTTWRPRLWDIGILSLPVGQPLLAVQRKLRMEKADSQEWLSYKKIEGGDVPPPSKLAG